MTLSASTRRNDYTGNGAVAAYDYTFKILDDSHLQVTVADDNGVEFPTLTQGVDYTIDGIGESAGGTVTLIDAGQSWMNAGFLKNNYDIVLLGIMPNEQTTSVRNQREYHPEVAENTYDRLVMMIQQLQERASRALTLIVSGGGGSGLSLGAPDPLKFLRWNAGGTAIEAADPSSGFTAVSGELPSGLINGVNVNFTIANTPRSGSFRLCKNGRRIKNSDFTLVGQNLTMGSAPLPADELLCDYEY